MLTVTASAVVALMLVVATLAMVVATLAMVVATLAQSVGESPYGSDFPRGLRDRGCGQFGARTDGATQRPSLSQAVTIISHDWIARITGDKPVFTGR
ncbi:MAG: hypothetical protein ACYC0X_34145 [Pirellulaceae bacterium]